MANLKAPSINIPEGKAICDVSIINTQTNITAPPHYLVEPGIPGHEWMNLPTYAFHVRHQPSGAQVLFDLGARKDWENSVPHISGLIEGHVPGLSIGASIHEILTDGGVDLQDISAVILSHWHFDHSGDTGALPKHIKILVGPGFKEAFLPGYPTKEDSPFPESAFEGRDVVEIEFSESLCIGDYQAHDFFGDRSLFILNAPGHAIGHISALVRTTEGSYILMGGDTCHFAGSIRPSEYLPMPDEIPAVSLDDYLPRPCPCIAFTPCHPKQERARVDPFYNVSTHAASFYHDPPTAEGSVKKLTALDANPDILVIIAHDVAPLKFMNFFPDGTINSWQAKGWKEQMHWNFLNELPVEGRTHRKQLVDGLYKGGQKIRGLDLPEH